VCHVRSQGIGQARGQRVLRGPFIFGTLLDRCVGRRPVHSPMAERRRHVHDAVSAQRRVTAGQDVQPVHRHRVDHQPRCRSQPTRHEDVVSIIYYRNIYLI